VKTPLALVEGAADLCPLPFSQVTAPTLLIRGQSSGLMMRIGQWMQARHLPHAKTAVIHRAGHWMANEQDEAVADVIGRFVGV